MDLFVAYSTIIQSVFTGDTIVEDEGGSRIIFHEFPTQGFFALANMSTLMDFFSGTVRNISDSAHHLDIEINHHMKFIQDIYHHLKANFIDQFISNIFSPNTDPECGPEICNRSQGDTQISDMVPSLPYLVTHELFKTFMYLSSGSFFCPFLTSVPFQLISLRLLDCNPKVFHTHVYERKMV